MNPLRTIGSVTGATVLFGILFALLFSEAHPHAIMNGVFIGFVIGVISSPAEIFLFPRIRRHLRFIWFLIARSSFYVLLIAVTVFLVTLHHTAAMNSASYADVHSLDEFREFLYGGQFLFIIGYGMVVSVLINLFRDMNRLLGPGVLWNYITGRYHHPTEELRAFMFLDLKSSTAIAERLGNERFHRFLDDFFFDISPAIASSQGRIFQYVGDEVVVSWEAKEIRGTAGCLDCFFQIRKTIRARADEYHKRFGVVPEFKAGCHYGPVITGEIGDLKKDIVFHGDTMNTAARIRSECTTAGKDLLVSSDLLDQCRLNGSFVTERIGSIRLRGKSKEVELFAVAESGE